MVKYEIEVPEEFDSVLKEIAESAEVDVDEILQEFIDDQLEKNKVDMIVRLYKDGKLKAREAWKMSELSYADFQERATS